MTLPHFPELLSVVQNVIKNTLQDVLQTSGSKLAKFNFAKNVTLNVPGMEISFVCLHYVRNQQMYISKIYLIAY